jgi:hypothetical protein
MKIRYVLAVAVATCTLGSAPAFAIAAHVGKPISPGHSRAGQPGNASLPAKVEARGKLCQAESKKHVAGMKGTPYSQCVVAAAHLRGKHKGMTVAHSGAEADRRLA